MKNIFRVITFPCSELSIKKLMIQGPEFKNLTNKRPTHFENLKNILAEPEFRKRIYTVSAACACAILLTQFILKKSQQQAIA